MWVFLVLLSLALFSIWRAYRRESFLKKEFIRITDPLDSLALVVFAIRSPLRWKNLAWRVLCSNGSSEISHWMILICDPLAFDFLKWEVWGKFVQRAKISDLDYVIRNAPLPWKNRAWFERMRQNDKLYPPLGGKPGKFKESFEGRPLGSPITLEDQSFFSSWEIDLVDDPESLKKFFGWRG